MIERVVSIGAELEPKALMDAEGLRERRVEVDVARTGEDISSLTVKKKIQSYIDLSRGCLQARRNDGNASGTGNSK